VKKIIIAIDGYSSCGKSTLARDIAAVLNFGYVDSGAMYRAVTLFFLDNNVALHDDHAVAAALDNIRISFRHIQGQNRTILNDVDVEDTIREMRISGYVSPVAAVPAVRRALVQQQKSMGEQGGIVMDGRDIGTVVFPAAELKIFLTAEIEERVRRRALELQEKGNILPLDDIRHNLLERDFIDSNRADSPLRQAEDAIVIDNTHLDRKAQLEKALLLAMSVMQTSRC
jgi:cytidylate kinase